MSTEVRKLRKKAGLTQEEAAQKCGIPLRTFADYDRGETSPPSDRMQHIRRTLKREGTPKSESRVTATKERDSGAHDLFQDDITLDVYTDIKVQAGDGRVVYPDEAREKVSVPRHFLSKIIGFTPPTQVGMMVADGDSMHPTIEDGDMILWEPVDEVSAGVYVMSIDDSLVVKRVNQIPGGGLKVMSDNDYHGYPDYTLLPENEQSGTNHYVNEETKRTACVRPVGKVLFPKRDTSRMHVKQVGAIINSVVQSNGTAEALA